MTALDKEGETMNRRSFIALTTSAAAIVLAGGGILPVWGDDPQGSPGPTVETNAGKLRGLALDGNVYAFKGVRYGASTEGPGRFMPPAKVTPWTGVQDAFELGPRSPQGSEPTVFSANAKTQGQPRPAAPPQPPMSEDCLRLNVWTSGLNDGGKRPVMLWLHGGGYSVGSGGGATYDGANLAKKYNVIVVTVNHRLNLFGYLYLAGLGNEKLAHSSNLGMLDIVASLQWVHDNIAKFGGDPGNVTIFGQSGGGGKVSTLMAMPPAKGLFHRAIIQSGSEVKGIPAADATKSAEKFLAQLNLKPDQLDQLQSLPQEQLLSAQAAILANDRSFRMSPVVDGHTLPTSPFDPVAPSLSAHIPVLIGSVETEVTFFPGYPLDPIDDATLHERVKKAVNGDDTQADHLIEVYRKGRPNISNTDLDLILESDSRFRAPVLLEAERKAAQAKASVYMYYFTWRSPARDGKLRTPHTVELPFVFENVDASKQMVGDGEDRYALADKVSAAWTAFARTGNPSHQGLPAWPAFDNRKRATMVFNDECKVQEDPGHEERLALNEITHADRG
jgi:para-nitrobenzyl esterase